MNPRSPNDLPLLDIPLLEIRGLAVRLPSPGGRSPSASRSAPGPAEPVIDGLDLRIAAGEAVGLVGASGSGKSMTARAVMGLLPPGARVDGRIELEGHGDLLALDEQTRRRLRGSELALVFQEPLSAFNPVLRIGTQIAEVIRAHPERNGGRKPSRRQARERGLELLHRVSMPDPEQRWRAYPHELSGGQRQRAMIAMALAGGPRLLLADEPTTALDVTVQARVLKLLAELRAELGLALLLITHDLAVVAELCERVVVIDQGRVVEEGSVEVLFQRPTHAVTRELLAAARRGSPG